MKKMMKKTVALLFALCAVFTVGCTEEEILESADLLLSEAELYLEDETSDEYIEETTEEVSETETQPETDVPTESETEETTEPTTEEATEEYVLADEPFETELTITKDGIYTSKEDVALYIYTFDCLPDNFITKNEARELGWEGGSLEPYAPGMCIGGSYFGNYEGLLPEEEGRTYTECDIDTLGAKSRGAKRIVFSNDGLIYYTDDHYESFELLYGEE